MKKKVLFSMTLGIILIVSLITQTQAKTTYVYQDVTAYTGSTNGHGGDISQ